MLPVGLVARAVRALGGAGLAAVLVLPAPARGQAGDDFPGPAIRRIEYEGRTAIGVFEAQRGAFEGAVQAGFTPEDWRLVLAVRVADGPAREAPPMLGSYSVSGGALVFTPRFGLKPGVRYRVAFDPSSLPGAPKAGTERITADIRVPGGGPPAAETRIEAVYPSGDELPENLLRFYVQFSAPMRQGESYRHVHLVAIGGDEVELPFLEVAEELWDPGGRRLTLLLDPGRIKRGLVPHEEVGVALRAETRYALVIDRSWRDARGAPLVEGHRKEFLALPPDRSSPRPSAWRIDSPEEGTREPLSVGFPEPLDQALLHRLVWVEDGSAQPLRGAVETRDHESRWLFVPDHPWGNDSYAVRVDPALEDLAGNGVGRPFEVLNDGGEAAQTADTPVRIPFGTRRP